MSAEPACEAFFAAHAEAPMGPGSLHLNPSVRAYLAAVRDHLLEQHDKGVSSREIVEAHADLVDALILKLFQVAEERYFENFPRLEFRIAVVAVGGYGRRELCLGSDIDLLFIHPGKVNPYVETVAELITQRLWDARLVVGAATRTLADCMRVGTEDLSTLTSYLDARLLGGDEGLFAEFERKVRAHVRRNPSAFLEAKLAEQAQRHERFGESLYLLQPNVKEGVGALRDYHTARWVARAVRWEVDALEKLRLQGFVDDDEFAGLERALLFLWRVRNELHRQGRKDDRLHYAAQERLAEVLGYPAAEGPLPIERFMRDYYLHAREVERVSRRIVDHARALVSRPRPRGAAADSHAVAEGFAIADGRLEIPSARLLRDRPARLFAAFAVSQHHDVELSPRAERVLRQHVHLIDDRFRADPEIARFFLGILRAPIRVYRSLKQMDELGFLGAYLPEFGHLVSLWQHDHYHTYTVDVHSLFLVEQMRRILKGRYREELPLATSLMRQTREHHLLYLGGLLHDIGKGRGGGHSKRGADLVPSVCARLGLCEAEIETVRFLVLHHLTMSEMAERRDVHDPRTILRLAGLAGTRELLRRLYLLTVADIRSVSAEAWTTWKGGLLAALYRNASEWLEAHEEDEAPDRFFLRRAALRLTEMQRAVAGELSGRGLDPAEVNEFLDAMPRRYLLNHGQSEVAAQVEAALEFQRSGRRAGVATFPAQGLGEAFWGVVLFARDERGLFAQAAGVLSSCGHNILGAQAYTTRDSLAVDIFELAPLAGGPAEEAEELRRIETRLGRVLEGDESVAALLERRRDRRPQGLRAVPARVEILYEESDFYTVIDVQAQDRPALLYDLARTLAAEGLDVFMSRIVTRAGRAQDSFYVTDRGDKITDPERAAHIERALLQAIAGES
jgi:[protein-PII] uridylyltransferase